MISSLVGLVCLRLINDGIGASGYGELAFVLAYIGGVCAIDLGFLQSIPRFVSQYSRPQLCSRRGIFWASCLLFISGLLVIQVVLLALILPAKGNINQFHSFSSIEILALGVTMITGNLLSAFSAILRGRQQYGRAGIAKIANSLCYLVAVILLSSFHDVTVKSVLWSYALATLIPNLILAIALITHDASVMQLRWEGFPIHHFKQLGNLVKYSLYGWLFTATTILISSGTIFGAGLILPSDSVAFLQISIALYTGVAAFVTGGMSPLTTIKSRLEDSSPDSAQKIAFTAHHILQECVVITAIILGFFVHHLNLLLSILLGTTAQDPFHFHQIFLLVAVVLFPGLFILPWFTFRFALVSLAESRRYSIKVFTFSALALLIALLITILAKNPMPIAICVALILVYRSLLAYQMGSSVLPGLSRLSIILPLTIAFGACIGINLFISVVLFRFSHNHSTYDYLHALLYMVAAVLIYILRDRLLPKIQFRSHIFTAADSRP